MTEDDGWHHQLNGHEFEQAPGDGGGQESLECFSLWGRKEQDTTEGLNDNWWLSGEESACHAGGLHLIPGSGISLEEGIATHSGILAWEIPWTEEPGRLQSTGSQKS